MAIDGKKTSEETQLNAADLTGAELIRLARGGANYAVSAAEFYSFIVLSNSIVSISFATFSSLQGGGFLSPMTWYYITDLRCYVFAVTGSIVSTDAITEKDVPYSGVNYGGVSLWENGGVYPSNEPVIYGNYVYLSSNSINPSILPPPDDANWTLQTTDSIYYRIEYVKSRLILVNIFSGYTVDYYIDQYGNETNDLSFPAYNCFNNKLDKYSYLYIYGGVKNTFYNNTLRNSSIISINKQSYTEIGGNELTNAGIYVDGEMINHLQDNVIRNIDLNFQGGDFGEFISNRVVFDDRSFVALNIRPNQSIRNKTVTNDGSNLVDTLDGSAAAPIHILNLNQNGINDIYGIFEIDVADIAIDNIVGYPAANFNKIILRPKAGRFIDIALQDATGVTTNGELVDIRGGGGTFTLSGDLDQYAIVQKSVNQGFDVFKITLSL